MGYAKWVAERTKLRSDLDGFGLSKSWLKSKVRTLLERDVMQSVSEVNQYEVSSTFAQNSLFRNYFRA